MNETEQRYALIEAGFRLAERMQPADLTPRAIAAEAQLEVDAVALLFGDQEQYLAAMQQKFLDQIMTAVYVATDGLVTGYDRLCKGAVAYLDACLTRRKLRGWLIRARLKQAAVADGLRKQNQTYLEILPAEFAAMRWPHPQAGARLYLAALQEVARLEHSGGEPRAELRNALWQFLRTYDRQA